jgi:hypothetical protein
VTTPKQSSQEQPSEQPKLSDKLKEQIERHLETMSFGELTLIVERGRIKFVRRVESEQAAG